jgi:hypothetical protein
VRDLLRRLFALPEPPKVAVEVRPRSVGVVRVSGEDGSLALAAAAALELPASALRLHLSEDNVAEPAVLRATLRSACERAGVAAGSRIALVLPDPVARVTLLPSSELPARSAAELQELVRFRLRKVLPYDVREARVSLRREGELVLAVAASRLVLDPYEAACRDCGLEPGQVELGGLVLQDAVAASRPPGDRLVVNWDEGYVSLLLTRGGAPALVRTLVGPAAESADALRREIDGTLLYYRERLAGTGLLGISVRSARADAPDFLQALGRELGVATESIEVRGPEATRVPLQAVCAAGASLFRRVA